MWVAVGGTPASVVRAATLGLPLALAIIGGLPENFVPFVDLYRETGARLGVDPAKLKVSINSHAFVGETSQAAADAFYPSYAAVMTRIGSERGWPPTTRQQFEASRSRRGALLVGSAQEVIDKILYEHSLFHHDRFLAQMDVGAVPHADVMRAIELLGTEVAPVVRQWNARHRLRPDRPSRVPSSVRDLVADRYTLDIKSLDDKLTVHDSHTDWCSHLARPLESGAIGCRPGE